MGRPSCKKKKKKRVNDNYYQCAVTICGISYIITYFSKSCISGVTAEKEIKKILFRFAFLAQVLARST